MQRCAVGRDGIDMTFRPEWMVGALLVAALAGCKQYDSPTTQTSPATSDRTATPSTTSGATGAPGPAAASPVSDQANQAGAGLDVADSSNGTYLVDGTGRALYMLQADAKGASSCYDACTTKWPPLLAPQHGSRAPGPSIKSSAIVNIQRTDGFVQVSYQGHPLYHFAQDTTAGQIGGQGTKDQFGEWYLLDATGKPIEGH